jgi:hypothetical protein
MVSMLAHPLSSGKRPRQYPREVTRRLPWDALVNARDLGGYPTTDGRAIRWGALVRSDSLSSLTPAGRSALLAHGVRTVIDLRMPLEVVRDPNPFGRAGDHDIAYHGLSFIDPALEPPGLAPTLAEDYALTAESLHAEEQRWLADGPGTRAEREATLERVRARPEVMLDVLAAVDERYGGVEAYLREAGVEPGDLDRLRDRFVGPIGEGSLAARGGAEPTSSE